MADQSSKSESGKEQQKKASPGAERKGNNQRQQHRSRWPNNRPRGAGHTSNSNVRFNQNSEGLIVAPSDENIQSTQQRGGQSSNFNRSVRGSGGGNRGRSRTFLPGRQFDRKFKSKFGEKERIDHAGVKMEGEVTDCLICCQRSDLYGIGECMHPICMECALRIRVVGECDQCPQCRAEITTLYFICAPPGQQLILGIPSATVPHPEEGKFRIKFCSEYAIECFNAYMANRCFECAKRNEKVEFVSFAELRQHISQAHQMSFCHICCDNLNVLTKDRKVYTRDKLQLHMNGKLHSEEEGFRGHPNCNFCEQRFYDDEQHYRHLRKEHYFCQFCDQDGLEHNVFYRNQHQLNQHNRRQHHPCTDPECLPVGIVFRTDTELDVHRAKQHRSVQSFGGRGVPLDIHFSHSRGGVVRSEASGVENVESVSAGPPPVVRIVPSAQSGRQVRVVPSSQQQRENEHRPAGTAIASSVRIVPSAQNSIQNQAKRSTEFPSLPFNVPYGAPPGWQEVQRQQHVGANSRQLPLQSSEQFPTLGGGQSSSAPLAQKQQNTIWGKKPAKELFKENSVPKQQTSKVEKRPKFLPSPECWPEGMREKLKARELGLPDPEPIVPPHWLNPPKKEKKRKSKTVSASTILANQIAAEGNKLTTSSSKFDSLAPFDESSEETQAANNDDKGAKKGKGKKEKMTAEWWGEDREAAQTSTPQQMKLAPSSSGDPDFVRIQLVGASKQAESEDENEEEEGTSAADSARLKPPPGFPALNANPAGSGETTGAGENHWSGMTMRSIASVLFGGGEGSLFCEEKTDNGGGQRGN